jgi:hypothetical protein
VPTRTTPRSGESASARPNTSRIVASVS